MKNIFLSKILISKRDYLSFTINGFEISKIIIKENNSLFLPYLINIYDEFRLLYCDSKKTNN